MPFFGILVGAVTVGATPLPPAGIWPLPKSSTCGPGAGASLSANYQLSASGPGANTDVVAAALKRYKSILLTPGTQAKATDGTISKVTVTVTSADDSLSDTTDYSYTIRASLLMPRLPLRSASRMHLRASRSSWKRAASSAQRSPSMIP